MAAKMRNGASPPMTGAFAASPTTAAVRIRIATSAAKRPRKLFLEIDHHPLESYSTLAPLLGASLS